MTKLKKTSRIKHHLTKHIEPHHKEPIAAVVVSVLLLALVSVFVIGGFITKDFYSKLGNPIFKAPFLKSQPTSQPNQLEAKINNISYSNGEPGFEPIANNHYLILDVDVVHNLDKPTWLTPLLQTYVESPAGDKFTMSPIGMENPFDARQYKIGEHAIGGLSYMVPKNLSNLKWCYEIVEQSLKTCLPVK